MRTAVVLLCLLAVTAIPGSLLPQRGVASDPSAVPQFMLQYPTISPWLDQLGLFGVYAAPWFAAIYLLLLVSMTGCVLPRSLRLWRNVRAAPPTSPTRLERLAGHRQTLIAPDRGDEVLSAAGRAFAARRFRVVVTDTEVRAEKGYLRELGNLGFHLSLLLLLVGVAYGKLVGFEGRVVVVEGSTFTNSREQYDAFSPAALTDLRDLTPFSLRLEDLSVEYEESGRQRGDARAFDASVTVTEGSAGNEARHAVAQPNHPVEVDGTKLFLTGNGYAPRVTVRDASGNVVTSGPVVFLPDDLTYASTGVIKAPDAQPEGLAFEGQFLPTATNGVGGLYSSYPDLRNPQLFLTAFQGDLGLDRAQSVFAIDKSDMRRISATDGVVLTPGDTVQLRGGAGSITFDGVSRFANFQVAYDPGKEIALVAALLLLTGLTMSLSIPRRRWWVRLVPRGDTDAVDIEVAGLSLTRRDLPRADLDLVDRWLAEHVLDRPHETTGALEGR